jgi:hypothetical protein
MMSSEIAGTVDAGGDDQQCLRSRYWGQALERFNRRVVDIGLGELRRGQTDERVVPFIMRAVEIHNRV